VRAALTAPFFFPSWVTHQGLQNHGKPRFTVGARRA
jgi:hypothetical protein